MALVPHEMMAHRATGKWVTAAYTIKTALTQLLYVYKQHVIIYFLHWLHNSTCSDKISCMEIELRSEN